MHTDITKDSALVKALSEGDASAFEYVMDRYHQLLCAYAFSISADYELSKDVVQDVFIKLWERRKMTIEIHSMKRFLYRAVYNGLMDYWRKNNKILTLETKHLETLAQVFEQEDESELKRQIERVTRAIQNLPPRCKQTLLLSKKEGMTNIEIAGIMNVSLRTVETQISKAFKILRKKLTDSVNPLLFLTLQNIRFKKIHAS